MYPNTGLHRNVIGYHAHMTTKSTPGKATSPTNPPTNPPANPDPPVSDADTANTPVHASDDDATADLHTVLRHLVSNQQWAGNLGARTECEEAMNRLFDSNK